MLLSFFVENQKKLSLIQSSHLDDLKARCEKIKIVPPFLNSQEFYFIPHIVADEEYKKLFQCVNSTELMKNNIFALFSSPLDESWKEILACKGDEQFVIRTGFYQCEFDILESILLGFHGLLMCVAGLDVFQLQYLTEVARDYSFSLFFVVHNKEELNLVLQTDAPYIVISAYYQKNFKLNKSVLYNLSSFVPKTASLLVLGPQSLLKEKINFKELGFSGGII